MEELDDETFAAIDAALRELDDPDSEISRFYNATRARWDEILRPLLEAIHASEQMTAEDYAVRITPIDEVF